MDRKEFLRACTGGLCACALAPVAGAAAAEAPAHEDWRADFVKQRYAKLLEVLSDKVGEDKLIDALHELGAFCAGTFDAKFEQYHGDVDRFGAYVKTLGYGDLFSYDPVRNAIIATSTERKDCICPLIGMAQKTPGVVCNCSIGWHTHAWQKLLGKKVRVALKESVMRGGQRCTLDVEILEQPA
jgi:hypothetical protein